MSCHTLGFFQFRGFEKDLLRKIAQCDNGKTNACRNLHRLLYSSHALFPVELDCAPITIAVRKPVYHTVDVWWPVFRITCWVLALLKEVPRVLLAGHSLADMAGWQATFRSSGTNMSPSIPVTRSSLTSWTEECACHFFYMVTRAGTLSTTVYGDIMAAMHQLPWNGLHEHERAPWHL